jgi:hypothetical protein
MSCAWYKSGKNRAFDMEVQDFEGGGLDIGGTGDINDWDDMMPGDVMKDMEDVIEFIPSAGSEAIPEAGPSGDARSRHIVDSIHLDQGDDERVEFTNTKAGWVIGVADTLYKQWHTKFGHMDEDIDMDGASGDKTDYAPFASEMDWRIANWVVKDGPGHGAFDRLLAIPDVSQHFSDSAIFICIF